MHYIAKGLIALFQYTYILEESFTLFIEIATQVARKIVQMGIWRVNWQGELVSQPFSSYVTLHWTYVLFFIINQEPMSWEFKDLEGSHWMHFGLTLEQLSYKVFKFADQQKYLLWILHYLILASVTLSN